MAQASWEIDPVNGIIYPVIEGTRQEPVEYIPIGGSYYDVRGGRLVDIETGASPYDLSRSGSSYVTQLDNGAYVLSNEIRTAGLNSAAQGALQYGFTGTVDFITAAGELNQVRVDFASVNKIGERKYAYRTEAGAPLQIGTTSAATLEELARMFPNLAELRWASAQETADETTRRWLIRNNLDDLRNYAISNNMFTAAGNPDVSGALQILFQDAGVTVGAVRSSRYIPAGG